MPGNVCVCHADAVPFVPNKVPEEVDEALLKALETRTDKDIHFAIALVLLLHVFTSEAKLDAKINILHVFKQIMQALCRQAATAYSLNMIQPPWP